MENNQTMKMKFKINFEDLKVAHYNGTVNSNLKITPCFEICNDEYFKNDTTNSYLRKRSIITFKRKNEKDKYPDKKRSPFENYCCFLKYGTEFLFEARDQNKDIINKQTYYTLIQKSIENGVENKSYFKMDVNENNKDFITKLIQENNYYSYFGKKKRKAFIIELQNCEFHYLMDQIKNNTPAGIKLSILSNCKVEIVAVTRTNSGVADDFYAEVEVNNCESYSSDEIEKALDDFLFAIFHISYNKIKFIHNNWSDIIKQQLNDE